MKRTSIILSLVFATALVLSSCRSHQKCPAYGKAQKAETSKKA